MSKKSKPSDLDELRQLGRWTGLESYHGVGYVVHTAPCTHWSDVFWVHRC